MLMVSFGASQAPGTTNVAIFIPVAIQRRFFTGRFFWANGSAVAGNVDCGIFDLSGNKLDSTGATAQAGTFAVQVPTTNTGLSLPAGAYYLGLMWTNATATFVCGTPPHAAFARAAGVMTQTGLAGTVPATATFTPSALTFIPHFGCAATIYR